MSRAIVSQLHATENPGCVRKDVIQDGKGIHVIQVIKQIIIISMPVELYHAYIQAVITCILIFNRVTHNYSCIETDLID